MAPLSRRFLGALAALVLLALAVACSSSGGDDAATSSGSEVSIAQQNRDKPVPGAADGTQRDGTGALSDLEESAADLDMAYDAGAASVTSAEAAAPSVPGAPSDPEVDVPSDQALIKTGTVALASEDVAQTRFEVQKIVDAHRGQVSERTTESGDDGEEARARLVVRVPVGEFDATFEQLEKTADLLSSSGEAQDVTTKVIDNGVRVELQRKSIDRISVLLDNARSLRDIVNIERELSRREADLNSLEKTQAYLADQTSMGTITISIEKPAPVKETKEEPAPAAAPVVDSDGFLSGLEGGWDALGSVTTGLLTVVGALLPFAIVVAVVGFPALLVSRRIRARRPARTPSAA